ncbi:ParB/RepB/Spo0J family partition protein, partial [Pseudoflavonifractor sp. 60]|uniref:ParB/RepB/Spo0J family partition protein n=1 Tax=Pseudoflavonifractor sp. 60 TaxID=2304576 RepID=UPI00136B2F70
MADEKLNVSPEENPQPSLFDTGPADAPAPETPAPEPPAPENIPEQAAVDAPAQDAPAGAPGEVSVSADQIEKLMAEQRAAGRAEVEKNEPPEPEQPPTPAPEDKSAQDKGPAKKGKTTGEKASEPEKPKARRGRKPKEEKAGPGEPGGTGARKGRPPKADKAAPDKPPSPPRDKMSQGKGGKTATVKEEAPAAPAPEPPSQPRDATRAEKEEIVYLKLSELFPFKDHPFGVRDDAEMKGLVASVKDNGVHQPALVRPREGGGYEIIAGHRRQRASELAGFANMPCIVRNMTDDEAVLAMTDDNLRHREKILPMEKAQSLKMQVEAISHQGAKLAGDDAKDVGKRSTEIVGERNGMNYKQVQRYI